MKKKTLFFISLVAIIIFTIFYSFKIEPYQLKVDTITLNQPKQEKPLKIVQFSDVHVKNNFTANNLHKVVTQINAQHPDAVIFTGDLYDNYAKYHDDNSVITQLKEISAPTKLAIIGNHDYGGGAGLQYRNIMNQAGFTLLKNQNYYLNFDNKRILFTGLDDQILGHSYLPNDDADFDYRILVSHEPDQVLNYQSYYYDLALSGHSHGGQINIPFLPFINKSILENSFHSKNYVNGMYSLSNSNIKKLYVNSGIGTTQVSARLGVPPKITVFKIYL